MASSYIWTGTRFIATFHLRVDTYQTDLDITKDPAILVERKAYEERTHTGFQGRDDDTFWLEDN